MKRYYCLNTEYVEHTEGENCLISVDPRCYQKYPPSLGEARAFPTRLIEVYRAVPLTDIELLEAVLTGVIDLYLSNKREARYAGIAPR
jgi:hypothetical protein